MSPITIHRLLRELESELLDHLAHHLITFVVHYFFGGPSAEDVLVVLALALALLLTQLARRVIERRC